MNPTSNANKLLDVPLGADARQIKAAYRRAALRWHPDARQDDPTAALRFQQIHQAYQTLSARTQTKGGPKAPIRRQTAVDFARSDLSWLYAEAYPSAMTHMPCTGKQRRLHRAALQARNLYRRIRPALRLCGWLLATAYLLLGTIGASRIVEGCHRRLARAGKHEPINAAIGQMGDQSLWIFAWVIAGLLVVSLAGRGQWMRRTGGALMISAAGTCLAMPAAGSLALRLAVPAMAAVQITAGCFLAGKSKRR